MSIQRSINTLRHSWASLVATTKAERVALNNLITIAKDKLDTVDARLETIESWKPIAVAALNSQNDRVTTLETQVGQAQTKFQQVDDALEDLEARIATLEGA